MAFASSLQLSVTLNIIKFWEVFKVPHMRTHAENRVQFLVCCRGYVREYNSWVNAEDTNEYLSKCFALHSTLEQDVLL